MKTKLNIMKLNRLIILITPFFFSSLLVSAQESVIEDISYVQLEQFIAMAKESYPKNKIMSLNTGKKKNAITTETLSYLDLFSASYYYRPNDKKAINPDNPYVFNGIQYGISVNLGSFLTKPFRVKEAKIDYEIAQLESIDYENSLIQEVKNRYYAYVMLLKELKLKTQTAQDYKGIADDAALRFERGEVELVEYNSSKVALNSANSSKIQTEVAYLTARDQLEEIIGKKLTEIKGL